LKKYLGTVIVDCDMILTDILDFEKNEEIDPDYQEDTIAFVNKFNEEPNLIKKDDIKEYGNFFIMNDFVKNELVNYFKNMRYDKMFPIKDYHRLRINLLKLSDFGFRMQLVTTTPFDSPNFASKSAFIQKFYGDCFDYITFADIAKCKNISKEVVAIIDDNPHILDKFESKVIKFSPKTPWIDQTKKSVKNNLVIYEETDYDTIFEKLKQKYE